MVRCGFWCFTVPWPGGGYQDGWSLSRGVGRLVGVLWMGPGGWKFVFYLKQVAGRRDQVPDEAARWAADLRCMIEARNIRAFHFV